MYYVYRFLDKTKKIVYIGKTHHLEKRMDEHFSKQGHLTQDQYKQVEKIEYVELDYQLDMDILEKYLINLWKPQFNTVDKDSNISLFNFNGSPLKWKNFNKNKIKKVKKKQVVVLVEKESNKTKENHFLAEEIRISNELIKILNSLDLSLSEYKLINAMIAQINPEDSEFELLQLSTNEIQKLCDIKSSKHLKRELNKIVFDLSNKNIFIKENKETKLFTIMKVLEYKDNILYFQFDDNLKKYLLNLKENFVNKNLKEIQRYKNKNAFKFNLLLIINFNEQKNEKIIKKEYSLEKLKRMLCLEDKYSDYNNFYRFVLKPALDEINEKGYYSVSFEKKVGKNNKCEGIFLFFSLGEKTKKEMKEKKENGTEKIKKLLYYFSFSKKGVDSILEKISLKEIENIFKELAIKKDSLSDKEKTVFVKEKINKLILEQDRDILLASYLDS